MSDCWQDFMVTYSLVVGERNRFSSCQHEYDLARSIDRCFNEQCRLGVGISETQPRLHTGLPFKPRSSVENHKLHLQNKLYPYPVTMSARQKVGIDIHVRSQTFTWTGLRCMAKRLHSSCLDVSAVSVLIHPVKVQFVIDEIGQIKEAIYVLEAASSVAIGQINPRQKPVQKQTQTHRLHYLLAIDKALNGAFCEKLQ